MMITTSNHFLYITNATFHGENKVFFKLPINSIENGSVITVMYASQTKDISFSVDDGSPVVAF